MILYHTSDREIRHPDIHHGRKNADFGQGFYLTPDRDFACRWAREDAVVNKYEFDEAGLLVRRFSRSTDWFDFILRNRRLQDSLTADAVIGPIANDTIFDTLGMIGSGFLKPEEALKLLMIGPEYTQVAVRTEKAAAQLVWTGAERISSPDAEAVKAEQEAYRERFAETVESLMQPQAILLNGPSSSGKSTLAKALRGLLAERRSVGYEVVSIDDHLKMSPSETIYEDDVFSISGDLCREAREALESGSGVIIDHVITSERIYDRLIEALSPFPLRTVRVACDPEVLRKRERERGDRSPGSAEASAEYLFPKEGYDLTVDTGVKPPSENALLIYEAFF